MTNGEDQPQPQDLDTGERLRTHLGAVAEGFRRKAKGEHETEHGVRETVGLAEVERIIDSWPEVPTNVARQMLEKYGPPNEATPTKLFWYRNRPWKRTELTSDVVQHNFPIPHVDFFTQVIDYRVPPEKIDEIVEFDGSVVVDRTRGEVAARCDSEAANVLAMNMVHEIATGKRTVDDARQTTVQNTIAYTLGRNAPYAERLLFDVPEGGTQDLDESMASGGMVQQAAGKVKDIVTGSDDEPTDRRTGSDGPEST